MLLLCIASYIKKSGHHLAKARDIPPLTVGRYTL